MQFYPQPREPVALNAGSQARTRERQGPTIVTRLGCPARDGRVLVRRRCQLGQAIRSRARCEDFLPQYHAAGPAANRTSESQSHVWKTPQAVSHKPPRKFVATDTSKELPWGAGHLQAVEMPIQIGRASCRERA